MRDDQFASRLKEAMSPLEVTSLLRKENEELSLDVQSMLHRPELLDVTFVCMDATEVRANRAFLASRNEYFSTLLYGDMKESTMERIPLPDVKAASLEVVISYLHGSLTGRFSGDSCWDDLVDTYLLAEQYQVNTLRERIVRIVMVQRNARHLGALVNLALERQAEGLLEVALTAMRDVVVFDSTSFHGWKKESIAYFLDEVQCQPYVTETLIAVAVLSASFANNNGVKRESSPSPRVEGDATTTAEPPKNAASSAVPSCSERERHEGDATTIAEPLKNAVTSAGPSCSERERHPQADGEQASSLSRKDLQDIFESHFNLPFIEPFIVEKMIEPLQILRVETLAALYRLQSIWFAGGFGGTLPASFLKMPWRSVIPKLLPAEVETREPGICKKNPHIKVSIPTLWSGVPVSSFRTEEELPQRVSAQSTGVAIMRVPLYSGKHIWRVRLLNSCAHFAVGTVSTLSTTEDANLKVVSPQIVAWWALKSDGNTLEDRTKQFAAFNDHRRLVDNFDKSGSTVVVILDTEVGSLHFANDLESYRRQTTRVGFQDLRCDAAMFPALWMQAPGCAEIEWIESLPRPSISAPGQSGCTSQVNNASNLINLLSHVRQQPNNN
ncbi:hypothetical protein CBR_g42106 [Chara braunii]|uniref:BTB domain-containing protein n=1 Tax=Chara braunii TaxID=69332 RepID=A0A388LX39_CHABU|nr:hypothetical protein CBR_g42106 [Chara braunii]|eukprot:GBG86823.1 hypothetical protein CBR_g42106 [Chara braunii]